VEGTRKQLGRNPKRRGPVGENKKLGGDYSAGLKRDGSKTKKTRARKALEKSREDTRSSTKEHWGTTWTKK